MRDDMKAKSAAPKRNSSIDMTKGRPISLILKYSVPLLLGNIMQQLYFIVDSWVVGNFAPNGDLALAAVGNGTPINYLVSGLFMGLAGGVTVVIAQLFGAGNSADIRKAANTIYALVLPIGIGFAALCVLVLPLLLKIMGIPEEIQRETYVFTVICMSGLIGPLGYNINAGIMQGMGDTKTPLILLICSTVINMALVLLNVIAFEWGVAGVAVATISAQFISWVAGIFLINRRYGNILKISPFRFKISGSLLREILRIGIPTAIQMMSVSRGNLLMQRIINSNGVFFAGGASCAHRIDSFVVMPSMTFSNAVTTFVGQNLGAGRLDRIKGGIRAALACGITAALLIGSLTYVFAEDLIGIFNGNPEIIKSGSDYLKLLMPFYTILTLMFVYSGIMRGMGKVLITMVAQISGQAVLRVIVGTILNKLYGGATIYYAFVVGWIVGAGIVMVYYHFGSWKKSINRYALPQPE